MLSNHQTHSSTTYPFKHRANEADLRNSDEVFDAITAMTARSSGILNSVANQASRLDKDLFWSIQAVAMEITDIIEIIHAHYEALHSGEKSTAYQVNTRAHYEARHSGGAA